ncbi:hypothetical protein [Marinobacter zhejiangensis]|uniref:Uncharacterized protein n=1 Tax=Marinobacter zhejiangensis TaxID=488535 RepID=A0A1I4T3M6_9GAMM|nr:hypothetical protein [Marinobacter zhejiangensis]SFM71150.1 hypothetical protein SAMN04487963_3468 [Marinobacter zhejiangensis]
MRRSLLLTALILAGCDNTTISAAPNYALFETSEGVVYLINQNTGELKVISPARAVVLNHGDVFKDGAGELFRYLGDGNVEPVDGADWSANRSLE